MLLQSRLLLLLLLTVTGQIAAATQNSTNSPERAVKIEHYQYSGESPRAKLIRVINPFGSITTRTSSHKRLELSGAIQKIGDHPAEHQIDIRDLNGVTEVTVSYPDGIRDAQGRLTGRFDLGVWLPSWVTVEMSTDFGDINVKKHASDIVATTNSGKISIGTGGLVNATSQSGDIKVDLYGEIFNAPMQIASQTGNVKVNISQHARLALKAQSLRPIEHNFGDYEQFKLSNIEQGLSALLYQPAVNANIQAMTLALIAKQGKLSIYIADKVTRTVNKTPINVTKKHD